MFPFQLFADHNEMNSVCVFVLGNILNIMANTIFTSRIITRGNIIGHVCASLCLSVDALMAKPLDAGL